MGPQRSFKLSFDINYKKTILEEHYILNVLRCVGKWLCTILGENVECNSYN